MAEGSGQLGLGRALQPLARLLAPAPQLAHSFVE